MSGIKVSIIVPVYNAQNSLVACLDSALAQTLSDIEVLLIDDGSTDQSSSIILEYAKLDSRVRYFYQQNLGVSHARNRAIKMACGEYLAFLDSDDVIRPEAISILYDAAERGKVDIVECRFITFKDEIGFWPALTGASKRIVSGLNSKFFNEYLIDGNGSPYVWDKIYKREKVLALDNYFKHRIGEDYVFNIKCFSSVDSFLRIDDTLYGYRKGNVGLSRTFNPQHFDSFLQIAHYKSSLLKAQSIDDLASYARYNRWYFLNFNNILSKAVKSGLGFESFVEIISTVEALPSFSAGGGGLIQFLMNKKFYRLLYLEFRIKAMCISFRRSLFN